MIAYNAKTYHVTPLVSFYTPWKHQTTSAFYVFKGYRKRPVVRNGLSPAGNIKVDNRNTRSRFEICSKLTKTTERRHWQEGKRRERRKKYVIGRENIFIWKKLVSFWLFEFNALWNSSISKYLEQFSRPDSLIALLSMSIRMFSRELLL